MIAGFSIESFPAALYEKYKILTCRDTIYAWIDKHEEFSDSKKVGTAGQLKFYEDKIKYAMETGVKGFPTAGWIFTMKNKFQWRDNPQDENQDDRMSLSDIMKSVDKNEGVDTTKKKRLRKKPKK